MSWENDLADLEEAVVDAFRDDAPVPYTPKGGATFDLRVVWIEKPVAAPAHDRSFQVQAPSVAVKLADFPAGVQPRADDSFVRKGVAWVVAPGIEYDGAGGATLPLKEA